VKKLTRTVTLAAMLILSLPTAVADAAARQDVPYVYEGTVHEVTSGSLKLIIGVGLALRLVQMQTTPTTAIVSEGAALAPDDLRPGDVVRADCRRTDTGLIADRIEIKRRGS
jgi:hypothetical protein